MPRTANKKISAALAFLGLLLAAALAGRLAWLPVSLYLGLSGLSFVAYAIDKRAARRQRRRTPESTLHLLSICGGWPGAILAQESLRHKSRKPQFRRVFWLTVVVNVAALVTVLLAQHDGFIWASLDR